VSETAHEGERSRRHWRSLAREAAFQMLYQCEIGRTDIEQVVQTFWHVGDPDQIPLDTDGRALAATLAIATVTRLGEIDPLIENCAQNWRLERMPVVDRLVLRLAVAEFLAEPTTPRAVVIDEALELARRYSADEALPFINGVLDAIRRQLDPPVADPLTPNP
jgi:transcription antitermination protein NusB